MEIEFLRHFGFQEKYIRVLQKAYGMHFLPLQEKGIQQGNLFEGHHLLVQAPTSSGKTMLAELLFLHHIRIPRGTLLLVPTKALANQRYHELRKRYHPIGLKICLSTRDHPHHDRDIRNGDFHLVVIVYEKLLSLLVESPTLLSYTGACVMDEVHYVLDSKRGMDIDMLLTRIKEEPHIQRMGLSAIPLDDTVCSWLGVKRLEIQQRPVELRQGVLCGGKFYFREFNTSIESIEEFPLDENVDEGAAMLEAALHFYDKNESTLLFFPTRSLCYTAARKYANKINPNHTYSIEYISNLEDSSVKRFLLKLLPKRIAIHTSDLTTLEREAVEGLIQQNEIRTIFATSTLAEGINFPVTNVITTKHIYAKPNHIPSWQIPPTKIPLTYDRLQNMTGRAGRLGYQESGRGMIVTCYEGEIDGLKQLYLSGSKHNKSTHPAMMDRQVLLIKLFALFRPSSIEQCCGMIQRTYYGSNSQTALLDQQDVHTVLQQLQLGGFTATNHNGFYLTGTGRCVASQGFSISSAKEMLDHAKKALDENQYGIISVLVMTALLSEIAEIYVPVSSIEVKTHIWIQEIKQKRKTYQDNNSWLQSCLSAPSQLGAHHHGAFKKVMLCLDWIEGRFVIDLEEKYKVYAGLISRLTSEFAWLVHAFAELLNMNENQHPFLYNLQTLQYQLLFGLPAHALEWGGVIQTKKVTRQQALQIIEMGYNNPALLTTEDAPLLASVLPEETVTQLLAKNKTSRLDKNQMDRGHSLKIDTARPDQVYVSGKPVRLTKMQSQLIRCLAHKMNRCVSYENIMNELWGNGLGDRKGLNRLKNQITQKCVMAGGAAFNHIIEVVPGVGMALRAGIENQI